MYKRQADKSVNFIRYCYSIQEQQKLINLILVNDLKGIDQLLQEIYDNNFKDQSLSASMQKLLYAQLVGTILNCNDDSSLASEIDNLLQIEKPKAFFAQAGKMCIRDRLCTV